MNNMSNYNRIFNNKCNLYIYGDIPDMDGYSYSNTPWEVLDTLNDYSDLSEINIFINSGGGSVSTGFNTINLLNRYKAEHNTKINIYIDGIAGSMAGVLAIAVADKLYLYNNSLLMIHLALTTVTGNKNELMEMVKLLDSCDKQLKDVFMQKIKNDVTEEKVEELMANETWFNARDINEYFDIEISFLDYCNNETLLNSISYDNIGVPTGKLGFLIEEKQKQLLDNKLKGLKSLLLNNL